MEQSNKIRAVFGAGFAVLLGIGIAAVFQTFVWENSVTQVARTWEILNRLDGIAYTSKAAEESGMRFAFTSDGNAAAECGRDLAAVRGQVTELAAVNGEGSPFNAPALQSLRAHLATLLEEEYVAVGRVLDASSPEKMARVMAERSASGKREQLETAFLNTRTELRQVLDERLAYQAITAMRARRLFLTSGLLCCFLIVVAGWQFSLDLGRREVAGRAQARRDEHYRQVVEQATDMVFRLDDEGRFVYCNAAALELLHYSEKEAVGRSYTKLVRLDMRREVERFYLRQAARGRKNSYFEFPIVDGYGRERWIGQNVQMLTEGEEIAGFQAIARDITERKRTEAETARRFSFMESMAAAAPGFLYVFDLAERKTVFANRELAAALGYGAEAGGDFDRVAARLIHPDDVPALRQHHEAMRRAGEGELQRIEYRARHADGNWLWFSAWETPFTRDADGRVRQLVGVAQDVTAHNAARETLTWQANYDTLTRLANRQHFWTRLQNTLRRSSMDHSPVSLCAFDIDQFKDINDQFGHAAGDEVLEAVGMIVRSELRPDDAGGRLGGDEFCFVLHNVDHEEAARLAGRIRERLNTMAFGMNGGSPFTASATFGVAAWRPNMDAREFMEAADRALYRAKAEGRNRVCVGA